MKRILILTVLLAGLSVVSASRGADDPATASAEREAAEERYKALNARLDGLEETFGVVRKRLAKLDEESGRLREEVSRLTSKNSDAATKENLERLAKSIEEVDRKRQSDNDKVLAALTALQKSFEKSGGPAPRSSPSPPATPRGVSPGSSPGGGHSVTPPPRDNVPGQLFEYTIKKNDTLLGIVGKLRSAGYKVTQKQLEDANPGVDWKKLKIDQKIKVFIPQAAP